MSPLRIEIETPLNLGLYTEGTHKELKENPVRVVRKSGKEEKIELKPGYLKELTELSPGDTIILPDLPVGNFQVGTEEMGILQEFRGSETSIIDIIAHAEGTGIQRTEGEIPVARDTFTVNNWTLQKLGPKPVYVKGEPLVTVSWVEKG